MGHLREQEVNRGQQMKQVGDEDEEEDEDEEGDNDAEIQEMKAKFN